MDNVEKLSELSNCADSVHTHPVNVYQHFVNAFVYINNSYGRQDAVRKAQEVWKVGSDEKKDYILKEAFRKIEMTTKRKITSYKLDICALLLIINTKNFLCIKYGPIEACIIINIKSAFFAYAFREGRGGREKAYVLYARDNADKYGRPLTHNKNESETKLVTNTAIDSLSFF